MKYLLHIDTSGGTGMVAIGAEGRLLELKTNTETRNHAASLNLMIEDLLAGLNLTFADLEGVVVCGGPGSYTGLRIGLATAKGFCYALDIPLLMHNRLTLLAYQVWRRRQKEYDRYIALLRAREQEYFIAVYDENFICSLAPQHITEKQYNEILDPGVRNFIIGDAPLDAKNEPAVNNLKIDENIEIDPEMWVFYAWEAFNCHETENLSNSEPFYLKQVYTHN
jgi:tRNA threonylcarbamoyladenosine biosynthesis protein TsaB